MLKDIVKKTKLRLLLIFASAAIITAFELLKNNYCVMSLIAKSFVMPLHRTLSVFNSGFSFSAAGVLIAAFVLTCLAYLVTETVLLIIRPERLKRLIEIVITALSIGLAVYAGFCLMWGIYYYGTDFVKESGVSEEPVTVQQLYDVTEYFAAVLNEYSDKVERNDTGIYCGSREAVLEKSDKLFSELESELPFLSGPSVKAKPFMFSYIMSAFDFTGFFFPFTAEANVNTHFPPSLFASTAAHELAHLRGVAREQEANFVSVLACMKYGDCDYIYSGAMLAYIHLGNALYRADYGLWESVYYSLNENVRKDLSYNNAYWKQFEAPVKEMSNKVYESFLQSYGQDMGLQSYGACVDLIVNYFYEFQK